MADGSIVIDTKIDQKGIDDGAKQLKKSLERTAKMAQQVGKDLTKYITGPLLALGGLAFASANEFDKAFATIRAGTGATGDALEDLKGSFKEVLSQVPQSAGEVGTALADINTRTGATGEKLEKLTKQFLDLGRVAGEDVPSLIASGTRVFGDWSIAAEEQGDALDYLWKVSQTTGIGVTDLSNKIVQFGAPLRQFGFSFEESAAIMGKWEKEGVNLEVIMSGMRQSLGRLADAGKDPQKEFPKIIEQIQAAGNAGEANALAIETFGARAGPDMAAAIREGRFELDDLMETLGSSSETIGKAGEDTLTLSEQFSMLKNEAMIGLEPVGKIMLDLAKQAIPPLIDGVTKIAQWFTELSPVGQKVILAIGAIIAILPPLIMLAGSLGLAIMGISWPILAVIAGIALLIAAGVAIAANWEEIKNRAILIWTVIKTFFITIWEGIKTAAITIWNGIKDFFVGIWDYFRDLIKNRLELLKTIISTVWNAIKENTSKVWNSIKGFFTGLWDGITSGVEKFKNTFLSIWNTIKNGIRNIVNPIIGFINGMITGIEKMVNAIASGVNSLPSFDIPDWVPGIGGGEFGLPEIPKISLPRIPSLNIGTDLVTRSGLAMIHEGEKIVPAEHNGAYTGEGSGKLHLEVVYNVDGDELYRIVEPHVDTSLSDKITFDAYLRGES